LSENQSAASFHQRSLALDNKPHVGVLSQNALKRGIVYISSPADELPVSGTHNPRFRQTVLDETFQLAQGKPLVLGSFDFPGTTRHQEVEVVAELVR
jgi:hypothetical protein